LQAHEIVFWTGKSQEHEIVIWKGKLYFLLVCILDSEELKSGWILEEQIAVQAIASSNRIDFLERFSKSKLCFLSVGNLDHDND
jgi:hypothetical protein